MTLGEDHQGEKFAPLLCSGMRSQKDKYGMNELTEFSRTRIRLARLRRRSSEASPGTQTPEIYIIGENNQEESQSFRLLSNGSAS